MASDKRKPYRVLKTSYINDKVCEPGEVVFYDGKPGDNLEELKGEDAKAADEKLDRSFG